MTALENRPLEDFVGLNWSCWVDGVTIVTSDAGPWAWAQSGIKYGRSGRDSVSLWKEEMHIFGECPSRDDFCLVVCDHCGQVVKLQAFERHYERQHGPLPKTCAQWRRVATQQGPHPNCPVKLSLSSSSSVVNPPLPHQCASIRLSGSPPSELGGLCRPSCTATSPSKRAPNSAAVSPTDPQGKNPARERICNTEGVSVAMKQRVGGQDVARHHFDVLIEKTTSMKNCHVLRASSQSFPEKDVDGTVNVAVQTPYPFNQRLMSSEENEDDEREGIADLPATPWHPKPLGICTFGCRTLGCSLFTFDRRLHHLCFALAAMLEHHVSPHLWKKIPQLSSTLRSRHITSTSVKSGAGCSFSIATATSQLERTSQATQVPRPANGHDCRGKKSHSPLCSDSNRRPLAQKRKGSRVLQPLKCQRISPLPYTTAM
ncbi:ataxin-7-like protein 2 isoform X2 [Corythoichthys intestinalis]|uniref:ataxin-7-like protein 2 isoform X2 n=1 Tax=Corythoichthys intestinalis TaxID=161448 RepID=UPI0025A5390D|nr:ataxin-7-like protein 2 isoform X2 [Corythoichthys intestinalis]